MHPRPWESQLKAVVPACPQSPPALPREPSVVPARLPARDQKGRSVVKGTPFTGPMVALGRERLLLTGKLQERVGKPQECQRRGDGGVVGMQSSGCLYATSVGLRILALSNPVVLPEASPFNFLEPGFPPLQRGSSFTYFSVVTIT